MSGLLSLVGGLESVSASSSDPTRGMVLREGSLLESTSYYTGDAVGRLRQLDEVAARTGVTVPEGSVAAIEGPPAGFINPRRLVAAQNILARRAGASIVAAAAESVTAPAGGGLEIGGPWGSVRAGSVVLATGAWGHHLLDPFLDGPGGGSSVETIYRTIRRPRTGISAIVTNATRVLSALAL